jgi:PAS domain S-box-containing protein
VTSAALEQPSKVRVRRSRHTSEVAYIVGAFAIVGLCYFAGAESAWRLFGASDIGLAFFPPAGVTLAALVLLPRRRWWAVLAAIVVVEMSVDLAHGLSGAVAAGYALANAVEPLVGAMLLLKISRDSLDLGRRVGMLRFLVAAVGAGAASGAVIGGLIRAIDSPVAWWSAALQWWVGDGLGILTIGVPIVVWREIVRLRGRRLIEGVVLVATLVVMSVLSFWTLNVPPAFLVLPILIWVAVRFETPGVAVASAIMAVIANVATASGRGPFASIAGSAQSQLAVAQMSLGAFVLTAWFLATESRERAVIAAEQLRDRAAQAEAQTVAAMGELSDLLSGQSTIVDIVDVVDAHVGRRFDGVSAAISLYDPDLDRFRAVSSKIPDSVRQVIDSWTASSLTPGAVAMRTGVPVWVTDRDDYVRRFPAAAQVGEALQLGVVGAMPLTARGVGRGALVVGRANGVPFDAAEREILEAIAGSVSRAIDRAELFEAQHVARVEAQLAHGEVRRLLEQAEFEAARLRESETRFKLVADQSPLIIWLQDADGRQEWANQRYLEFFGAVRDELNSARWKSRTHPDDIDAYGGIVASAVADRQPFHAESRSLRSDGEWRWMETWAQPRFDPDGGYLGHVGTAVDITDRFEAEAERAAAHQFVQELTALVPGVISVLEITTGRHVFVSRQSYELLGYEADDLVARGPTFETSGLHPDDPDDFKAHMQTARRLKDGESMSIEYRFRHRDGSWRWLRTVAVPLRRSPDGEVSQVACLTVDATEQKANEAQMRELAALEAFQVRVADALRDVDDGSAIEPNVVRLLAGHLEGTHARFVSRDNLVDVAEFGTTIVRAMRAGETIVVNNVHTDDRISGAEQSASGRTGRSAMVLQPLTHDAGAPRVLVVDRSEPHEWTENEVEAIRQAAERTGQAVRRNHSRRLEQLQNARSALAGDLLDALQRQPGVAEAAQLLVEALVPTMADYATVEQFAPGYELMAITHRDPPRVPVLRALREQYGLDNANAAAHAKLLREPQLLASLAPDVRAESAADERTATLLAELTPRSNLMVPLDLGGDTRGTLLIGRSDPDCEPYTRDDLAFVTDLARRVEVTLAAKRVREAEHQIAVTLQNALLPDTIRSAPSVPIDARYQAADDQLHVGGDWYDTFAWPDGRIGAMVGDVVGHSVESAAAMGRLRAAASALATIVGPSPAKLIEALDRFARSPDGIDYATVACVVIDPAAGTLTYASAGHPPTLVVTPAKSVQRLAAAQSPPLCTFVQGNRPETTIALEPGSLVVLYSDGLIERRRESLELGINRLETALVKRFEQSIGEILDGVISDLTKESPAQDDIVVVACRYTPALANLHLETPARPNELAGIRHELRLWLKGRNAATETEQALLSVIGEAMTNVVDHAYRQRSTFTTEPPSANAEEIIVLDVADHGHEIVAHINDHGLWRQPGSHSDDRGRGTTIIEALADRYTRVSTDRGTTVTVVVRAAARHVGPA